MGVVSRVKWELVRRSMASPALGRLAKEGGKALCLATGFHYKVGLSRAVLGVSAFARVGRQFKIDDGSILIKDKGSRWSEVYSDQELFGSLNHEFTITENLADPNGLLSYLRWNVFYDAKKVNLMAKIFSIGLGVSFTLDLTLSKLFEHLGHGKTALPEYTYRLINTDIGGLGFYPEFHALGDPNAPLVTGDPTIGLSKLLIPATMLLFVDFHKDSSIAGQRYKSWSKFANPAMALGLAGVFSLSFLSHIFDGAWNYFYAAFWIIGAKFNISDLFNLCSVPVFIGTSIKMFYGSLWGSHTFRTSIVPSRDEVE